MTWMVPKLLSLDSELTYWPTGLLSLPLDLLNVWPLTSQYCNIRDSLVKCRTRTAQGLGSTLSRYCVTQCSAPVVNLERGWELGRKKFDIRCLRFTRGRNLITRMCVSRMCVWYVYQMDRYFCRVTDISESLEEGEMTRKIQDVRVTL